MEKQLAPLVAKYKTLEEQLALPATYQNPTTYTQLHKAYKQLTPLITAYQRLQKTKQNITDTQSIIQQEKDPELCALAQEEIAILKKQQQTLQQKIQHLLIPGDPNDAKNSILEIRAGTGGREAALFAGTLFRMYQRFADKKRFKITVLSATPGASGGYKEITANITGTHVYGTLKYESGVHRVQRVPTTETQGRIHTSAASVVILPEVDPIIVKLNPNDIKKETFCSSGPGGQSVNTTYSAVRLTHIPTGIVASCQDGKSQIKNYEKALTVLSARIYAQKQAQQQTAIGATRKSIVRTGDRSDKIRTYNYPQGRLTDHRIQYTSHNLPNILDGALEPLITALQQADHNAKINKQIQLDPIH